MDPAYIFKPDLYALALALILEIYEKPIWWRGHLVTPYIHPAVHPVALTYRIGKALLRPGGAARGAAILAAMVAPMAAAAVTFRHVRGEEIWWSLAEAYMLKTAFSIRHVTYGCLEAYAKGTPHDAVKEFVRRPLDPTDRGLVNSACVETAAESLVDSYISPLLWYAAFGLPGAWVQRAVNTADGLVGFKTFGRLGLPAAAADTAINFIPARLAAALILATGVKCIEAMRDMAAVESINARWPIAAAAAALGVKLEKQGHYAVGCWSHPHYIDVAAAIETVHKAAYAAALLTLFLAAVNAA